MQIPVNGLRAGAIFEENNQPFKVLKYEHVKMGRGNANIKLKVKNLKTGGTFEKTFMSGAKVEASEVENKKVQFLYSDPQAYYFMDNSTFDQFTLSKDILGGDAKFLKEGLELQLVFFKDEPITVELPTFIEYTVKTAGSSERGNSVSNIYKSVILESGLQVQAPLFIKDGDKIKVDTRDGSYVERLAK